MQPFAIVITGGGKYDIDANGASVPKSHLAGAMQVALQTGRLKIAAGLPESATLLREMQTFKVKISNSGHEIFESGANAVHDDLVLATMMSVWTAERKKPPMTAAEQRELSMWWNSRVEK